MYPNFDRRMSEVLRATQLQARNIEALNHPLAESPRRGCATICVGAAVQGPVASHQGSGGSGTEELGGLVSSKGGMDSVIHNAETRTNNDNSESYKAAFFGGRFPRLPKACWPIPSGVPLESPGSIGVVPPYPQAWRAVPAAAAACAVSALCWTTAAPARAITGALSACEASRHGASRIVV
jgi:hypothetical protein